MATNPVRPDPAPVCEVTMIHEDVVERVRAKMPSEDLAYDVSELFKVFGDSTRARILCALSIQEMCVCDLSALLGLSQSAVSHQLRLLKVSRIVKYRKDGRVVYYSLDDEHIRQIFTLAFEHITEEEQ